MGQIRPYLCTASISLITLILAWTNEYHNLIWDAFYTGSDKLNIIVYSHGIWFWIFNIFQFCPLLFQSGGAH
jgi:hypothetical protein